MKLYFSPGACSLAPHIVLQEAGFAYDKEKVDLRTKKTASGKDFNAVSEKGYVPLLELDNGECLSEGPAIVQYLADLKPESNLAPKPGTLERARLMEWLNFISTELHKTLGSLFHPVNAEAAASARQRVATRLEFVSRKLGHGPYLMGEQFSVADAYLYTVLRWAKPLEVGLSNWPNLTDYMTRVSARPKVQAALAAEGFHH